MAKPFAEQIVAELETFFKPITDVRDDPEQILALLSAAGWPLARIAGVNQQTLVDTVQGLATHVAGLAELTADPPTETELLLAELAEKLAPLFADIVLLKDAMPTGLPNDVSDLPLDVLSYLTTTYLARRTPPTYHVLRILGVILDPDPAPAEQNGKVYRVRNAAAKLNTQQLVSLIAQPAATFRGIYWPNGFDDNGAGAQTLALKVWDLAAAFGFIPDTFDTLAEDADAPPFGVQIGPDALALSYTLQIADEADAAIGVRLDASADGAGAPVVTLAPFGAATVTTRAGGWKFTVDGELEANPFEISSAGFRQIDATRPPFEAGITVARGDGSTPAFLFGAETGVQIRVDELSVMSRFALESGGPDVVLGFDLKPIAFRIALGGADGFLKNILPGEGIGGSVDIGLQWSNKRGVTLRGSASLTIELADQIVLGPVTIKGLTITLAPRDDTLNLELAATIGAKIGPAAGVVERIGVRLGLSAPEGGGNLGPLNLAVGFKPPSGLGLSIDASVVKGGGYLYIDTDRGEYAGALELTFAVFSLKAIAILTTKRPDGSQGWSLLLMIYAQFPSPIQLSYGFTLSGVGGLVGLHHGCDRPQLESGMRTGAFDSILFPRDPVGDAPHIISQLRVIFPIRPNALIIGPMLEIGWSSPNIIKIRLGVLIQLDNVFGGGSLSLKQILILGQLEVVLPPAIPVDQALLRLLIDFLGYIDLEEKVIGFIARLRDSHVSVLTITGMFVVRITWGDHPSFVLAAGGFHPAFTDLPPGLPSPIDRVGAGFSIGPVHITIEGYFAATPATIQAGARVSAEATYGAIDLGGHFAFDTIFYFEPQFHFQVDASCGFRIKWKGHTLTGVDFKGTFTGPGRWHIVGKAEFTVLLWTVPVPIDETWGDPPDAPAIEGTNVRALLEGDVANKDLWSAQMPSGGAALVTVSAEAAGNAALAHPLSRLSFSQRRVPLQLEMQRFGRTPVIGPTRLDVTEVKIGSKTVPVRLTPEYFARSAFVDMTKDEQLARPSFEPMPASVEVGTERYTAAPDLAVPFDFETIYLDPADQSAPAQLDATRLGLDFNHLVRQTAHADVFRSRLRRQDKLQAGSQFKVSVTEAPLAAADTSSLTPSSTTLSESETYSPTLARQKAAKTKSAVVEAFELVET